VVKHSSFAVDVDHSCRNGSWSGGGKPHNLLGVAIYGFVLAGNAGAFMVLRWTISQDTDDADLKETHVSMLRNNLFALML
jgi:hypothetical protein